MNQTRRSALSLDSLALAGFLACCVAAALEWVAYASRTGAQGYLSILAVLTPLVLVCTALAAWPLKRLLGLVTPRFDALFEQDPSLRRRRLFWALVVSMLLLALVPYPVFRVLQELARTVTSSAVSRVFISFASVMGLGACVVLCTGLGFAIAWATPQRVIRYLKPNPLWVWTFGFPFPFLWLPLASTLQAPVAFTPAARMLVPAAILSVIPPLAWVVSCIPTWPRRWAAATVTLGVVAVAWAAAFGIAFAPAAALKAPFTALVYQPLRTFADWDQDGFVNLWEGRDCDESDPAVHAHALDVPGNGVDENCDGQDASSDLPLLELGPNRPYPFAGARPFNVVIIVLDAVRADHLKLFGYARETAPNLEQLAQQSFAYSAAYSPYPSTGMAIPSLLTGRYPHMIQWGPPRRRADYPLDAANTLLPDVLRANGYYVGAVLSNWLPSHILGLSERFDVLYTLGDSDEWKEVSFSSSPISTAKGMTFLEKRPKDKPFFLMLHYADPHAPYVSHKSPGRFFGSRPQDRYDADIYWTDLWMGLFLHYLDHSDLWQDTVVVVLSDHGEEFEEHGMKNHGNQLHVESLHVPIVLRIPGMETGRTLEQPVSLIDVAPTILDLLGIEEGRSQMQGESLLEPALSGTATAQRPIFGVLADREPGPTRRAWSVLAGRFKLILDQEEGVTKLYNLYGDPAERWDIAGSDAENSQRLRLLLDAFAARAHPSFLEF